MFWEYSPLIASDWLKALKAHMWMRKKMDDCVDSSLTSEGIDLFVDLWEAQPCLWDPQ